MSSATDGPGGRNKVVGVSYNPDIPAAVSSAELIAEKDAIIAALREENANLRNRFNQLAGGFEIQGDHKSAERVRAAM